MEEIPPLEKEIFESIAYTEKYLKIHKKYIFSESKTPTFRKKEILNIFNEFGEDCRYVTGGAYVINRRYYNYLFECSFVISKNSINPYIYVYKNNEIIKDRVSHMGGILWYMPYDEYLVNNNFGLNSLTDFKNYLNDVIGLFNEYFHEYVRRIRKEN